MMRPAPAPVIRPNVEAAFKLAPSALKFGRLKALNASHRNSIRRVSVMSPTICGSSTRSSAHGA